MPLPPIPANTPHGLFEWIQTWPPTVVGVLIGSGFTFASIFMTNWFNGRNLARQFNHNREEKARERTHTLRRDIYLGMAETLAAGMQAAMSFGNLSREESVLLADFEAKSGALGKVHIVASEETALQLSVFVRALTGMIVELSLDRRELTQVHSNLKDMKEEIARHQQSRDQYIELMKQNNLAGTMTDSLMAKLQQGFDFESDQARRLAVDHDQKVELLKPKHMVFFHRCQVEVVRVTKLLLPLVASVRKELEEPIDLDAYAKVFERDAPLAIEHLERIFGIPMPQEASVAG